MNLLDELSSMDAARSQPPKRAYALEIIKLLTALVALAAALLGVTKQYPSATKVVVGLGLLVLL